MLLGDHGINFVLCLFYSFLTQYKGVYERDVKCQVKMSHNSGSVGQGPPSPSKDEVSTTSYGCRNSSRMLQPLLKISSADKWDFIIP